MPNVTPGSVHVNRPFTREYLEAFHDAADKMLPAWQASQLRTAAIPSSGGRAGRRVPEHSPIESALLGKLQPTHVADLDDEALQKAWGQLESWHKLAVRKGLDAEGYERAASVCAQEMQRRKLEWDREGDLGRAALAKSSLFSRMELLPAEISLGRAASLVYEDGELALCWNRLLGDDGAVSSALVQAGIPLGKSTPTDDLDSDGYTLGEVYDLLLRRPAGTNLPTDLSTGLGLEASAAKTFVKASATEKRLIGYVAAEPNVPDTYGHRITPDEVEDECHRFALGPREVYMEHGEIQGLNATGLWPRRLTGLARVVESFIVRQPIAEIFGEKLERPIPAGCWFVVLYYPDAELWEMLKRTPHGISWRGIATMEQR